LNAEALKVRFFQAQTIAMPKTETIIDHLAKTDLFKDLSHAELATCAAAFRKIEFEKGKMLFARGDTGHDVYLIAEGCVRLAVVSDTGRELSFRLAVAGDLFGEIAALDGGPRTADATALTPVIAYALDHRTLRQLLRAHASIGAAMVTFLCRRLRETSGQSEAIALFSLEVRLARFLLRALPLQQETTGKRVPLELGFSQSELARLLGASRPKVNAALGVLESTGAIRRTLDRIFCDPAMLAQIAQENDPS
jgi:CRP/FNR family transcriptional regulator, cyclic AMP receptor protein